jgi:hypothetical protein
MHVARSRRRTLFAAVLAALTLGVLGSAQAASAAPYVRYAHFTATSGAFYSAFGDGLDISIGNSPSAVAVCVSSVCKTFYDSELRLLGSVFGQFWAHGQSRQVKIWACNATCMPTVWVQQLRVP